MSFPRLTSLLGKQVEQSAFADWQRLIDAHTPEAFDLDFKEHHYSTKNPEAANGFATDVAALANTQGGVIVIGIREENQSALEATPVAFDEGLERTMGQWIAGRVFPKPMWEARRVPLADDHTRGLVLCLVPKSRMAPHAVQREASLRYPYRRNADNGFLSEHEIAERYRQRFVAGQESESRLATCVSQGRNGWRPNEPYVETALVPIAAGDLRLSVPLVKEVQGQISRLPSEHYLRAGYPRVATGFRRLRVRDGAGRSTGESSYGELHTDGVGYAAAFCPPSKRDSKHIIWASTLLCTIAEQIAHLVEHAARCGCVGDALLVSSFAGAGKFVPNLRLATTMQAGWGLDLERFPEAAGPFESRLTIPLEQPPLESMLTVRSVLTDWYQGFGVPEVDLIDQDGFIDASLWQIASGEGPEFTIQRRGSFPRSVVRTST